ncbi:DUF4344 domain-containing metallopeptidase [Thaumasiovibrio sp. DFM-14]|uniref:DUF4344 domain-containing metallopeptidase n=1 Tax=Thaumasiovibrio sp. DFM-14 TaxID=3384792 RepID=UPI0039A2DC53
MLRWLLLSLLLLLHPAHAAITLQSGTDSHPAKKQLVQQINSHIDFVNTHYLLPFTVTVRLDQGEGPLFDAILNEIWIPYHFVHEITAVFTTMNYYPDQRDNAVAGVIAHTFFHELGHAFIANLQFPLLGMEEDAVDTLATIIMINQRYPQDGIFMALAAADAFDAEDRMANHRLSNDSHFYGNHSLDAQRYYRTICLIVGADAVNTISIIEELDWEEAKLLECSWEYKHKTRSVNTLLAPYIKQQ